MTDEQLKEYATICLIERIQNMADSNLNRSLTNEELVAVVSELTDDPLDDAIHASFVALEYFCTCKK